jgi:cysteine desulfuration protein SufE
MKPADIAQSLIGEFELFADWEDKYAYIIDLGKHLAPYPEDKRTDDYLVRGCQSRVWLAPRVEGDRLCFDADSDAIITRGLIALLLRVYNNQRANDILSTPPTFVQRIGLDTHLSQSRANGLASMVNTIMRMASVVAQQQRHQGAAP